MVEAIKVRESKTSGYSIYSVTIPKKFVEELGLKKGDILFIEVKEIEGKKALIYYRP